MKTFTEWLKIVSMPESSKFMEHEHYADFIVHKTTLFKGGYKFQTIEVENKR